MNVSMVTISSRGQVVIPKKIMAELSLKEGEKLLVLSRDDNLLLKKITPTIFEQSLAELVEPMWKKAEEKGLTEKDIEEAIKEVRKERRGK